MHNVTITPNGTKVTIEFDVSETAVKAAQVSSTGRTRLLASTGGAVPVDCKLAGLKVALNVMIPR